jgi:hypothetical protein
VSVPDQAPEIARLLAVPSTIRRLDLYTESNDCTLAGESKVIEFASVPAGPDRDDARAVASLTDGRVVAQLEGIRAAPVGSVAEDGEFLQAPPRRTSVALAATR